MTLSDKAYIVSGLPHVLLAPQRDAGWQRLNDAYAEVRKELEASDTEVLLFFSTQWMSVLGHMIQGDATPSGVYVDQNWHDLGSVPYSFEVDTDLAARLAEGCAGIVDTVKLVDYEGFPIDPGTIVAQQLLNPNNRCLAAMVSCNIYSDKAESVSYGRVCREAIAASPRVVTPVLVTSLSHRFHTVDVDGSDFIATPEQDQANRKVLELLSSSGLHTVCDRMDELAEQCGADMGLKGFAWLSGLLGNDRIRHTEILGYEPIWGTGGCVVRMDTEAVSGHLTSDAASGAAHHWVSERAARPVGAYPHARRAGDLIFLSGPQSSASRSALFRNTTMYGTPT